MKLKKVFQYIGYIDVLDNKHFENFKAQLLLKTNDITLSKIFSDIINFYKEKDIINLMLACAINSYTYPKIIYNQNTQ